jgi:hypothetical protein
LLLTEATITDMPEPKAPLAHSSGFADE